MLLKTHLSLNLVKMLEGLLSLRLWELGPVLDDQLVVREDVGQQRFVGNEEIELVPLKFVHVVIELHVHCSLEDRAQALGESEMGLVSVNHVMLVEAGLQVAWVIAAHVSIVGLRNLLDAFPGTCELKVLALPEVDVLADLCLVHLRHRRVDSAIRIKY